MPDITQKDALKKIALEKEKQAALDKVQAQKSRKEKSKDVAK